MRMVMPVLKSVEETGRTSQNSVLLHIYQYKATVVPTFENAEPTFENAHTGCHLEPRQGPGASSRSQPVFLFR